MKKRAGYVAAEAPPEFGESPFPGDRQFVVALHRGLEILRCFRPSDGPLGNQELAQRSGLPKATVSRLTYTLSKLGYLVYLEDSGKYRMGVPVLGLGYACLGGLRIRATAQPFMDAFAEKEVGGELVSLGGRDDMSMIYLACARSTGIVSLQLDVGSRISLARSSMGRAYIAAVDEDERVAVMQKIRARVGEERWPALETAILRSVDEVRQRGFCLVAGEWRNEVNAVGVPLKSPMGDAPVLAFNCGGPSYMMSVERLEKELGPRLVELSHKVLSVA